MKLLRLSFNLLRRDWRAGEWRVLLSALVLAVGSLSTVGLFADRVRQALQLEAQSLIGADLRISSTRPLPPSYRAAAQARGLQTVLSQTFPSMVVPGNQSRGEQSQQRHACNEDFSSHPNHCPFRESRYVTRSASSSVVNSPL